MCIQCILYIDAFQQEHLKIIWNAITRWLAEIKSGGQIGGLLSSIGSRWIIFGCKSPIWHLRWSGSTKLGKAISLKRFNEHNFTKTILPNDFTEMRSKTGWSLDWNTNDTKVNRRIKQKKVEQKNHKQIKDQLWSRRFTDDHGLLA